MENQLDRLLAAYCSPALAGIKPANLVSCDRTIYPDLPEQLETYREAFIPVAAASSAATGRFTVTLKRRPVCLTAYRGYVTQ